jgi:excisionase family DNA binding protein
MPPSAPGLYDVVALVEGDDELALAPGALGTVVELYAGDAVAEVEFCADDGSSTSVAVDLERVTVVDWEGIVHVDEVEGERLLKPKEVAALFRVDPKTVTRWESAGLIDGIRTPGGHRRFRESVVRAFIDGGTTPAA